MSPLPDLYERDEVAWMDAMVGLLDAGSADALDLVSLRDLLASLADRERRTVRIRLVELLQHILQWEHVPRQRSERWREVIFHEQRELETWASDGVLRAHAEESFTECYSWAVSDAARWLGLPADTFPAESSFTLDQALAFTPPPLDAE